MRPSESLIAFLKAWEGLPGGKPALEAYDDGGGVWTIGYGHTHGVKPGDVCSAEMANDWLEAEVDECWHAIDHGIAVTLAQHEMDALTSLAYNIGVGAFLTSTLLRRLNSGDFGSAAEEFPRWCRDNGRIVPGLVKRRAAERQMFTDADYSNTP